MFLGLALHILGLATRIFKDLLLHILGRATHHFTDWFRTDGITTASLLHRGGHAMQ
jgi:hypothetical protein